MISIEKMTARQRQVLMHLLEGIGERQVASRLGISVHTVHAHVQQIYRTYDVHSLTELMAKYLNRTEVTTDWRPEEFEARANGLRLPRLPLGGTSQPERLRRVG